MRDMAGTHSRLFVFALTACALAGCDGGVGTPIGAEGGVVVSDDGRLTVEIPAGALQQTIDVSIHPVDEGPRSTVAHRAYAIEPLGTALVRPARVEYDWTVESDALAAAEAPLGDPALVIERGAIWQVLADRDLDLEGGTVAGSAHYLGIVAVIDSAP